MQIDERLLYKRLLRNAAFYNNCCNIDQALDVYRKNVCDFLQNSRVEVFCLHHILQTFFLWYQDGWYYERLYKYITTGVDIGELIEQESNVFEFDSSVLDTIRDNAENIEKRLLNDEEQEDNVLQESVVSNHDAQNVDLNEKVLDEADSIWEEFFKKIDIEYIELIQRAIEDNDAYNYLVNISKQEFKLPEMLIEEINEMALEVLGDIVLDFSGNQIKVFEEYVEEMRAFL